MKTRCASALALLLCLAPPLRADGPSPPDTPQGKRMAALLAAFDAGTPDAIRAFVTDNFAASALKEGPVEQRVQRLSGMARETGPLDFHSVVRGAGPDVAFLARSKKTGNWIEIGMRLEAGPSAGILGMRFEDSEGPGAPKQSKKGSDAEVAAATHAILNAQAMAGEFSGVVLIARDGKPFFHEAVGLAQRDFGVPNRPDTKFNLGSINKIFTQVAIAQLAEQGKLSFDDTIRKHLPDYPNPAADRITIQQLVSMTSGLGDIFGERYDATPKDHLRTLSDFLPLFASDPLRFEPGTGRQYSNAGYIVLGLIIEKVSGQSYDDYVRQHIFSPAGMKDTDAYAQDSVVVNRAVGYTRQPERTGNPKSEPRPNIYALPAHSSSAGGGYSTAEDLLRFDQAMRKEKLLSPDSTDWFFSDRARPPARGGAAPASNGPRKRSGGRGAAGGTDGVNAVLEIDLDTGYTVVVLSNLDPPSAERVSRTLRQWLGLN
jgi:CubicO group peptidase (beta-lactamase class C family)